MANLSRFSWHIVAFLLCITIALPFISAQTLIAEPTALNGEEGDSYTFTCIGPRSIEWKRSVDGVERPLVTGDKYEVIYHIENETSNGRLTIKEATTNDTGTYTCRSDTSSFDVHLNIVPVKDVMISPAEPEFIENADIIFNCTVNGAADQEVEWKVNKGEGLTPLPSGDDASHVQVFNNGSFIIRSVVPEDAGIYACTHTFTGGEKTVEVNLGGEITLTAEKSVKYTEGDRALIECEAHVITPALLPNFTWTVDGEGLDVVCQNRCSVTEKRTTHTVTSKLELLKITMDDRKNYTCTATNAASQESRTVLLRVRDRLAALWPFLGIVSEVVILIVIIFIHEKCSKGEDYGEDDEDDDDLMKEKKKISDGDSDMRMRSTKQ